MKNPIFSVHDAMIGYLAPFIATNESVAIRDFHAAIKKSDLMEANSKDFDLYYLGEFDDEDGVFVQIAPPKKIASGGAIK